MFSSTKRSSYLSFSLWVAFAAVGLYMVWPLKERPRRGIDLVGGFYITLKVDTQEGLKDELVHEMGRLLRVLEKNDIADPTAHSVENGTITFSFASQDEAYKAEMAFKSRQDKRFMTRQVGNKVTLHFTDIAVEAVKENAVAGNIEVLRKRLNDIGVADIPVSRQGKDHIIIELPNVDNPAEAKAMIGTTSQLEIKEVEASGTSEDDILDRYDGVVPEGMILASDAEGERGNYYLVSDYAELTGRDLKTAKYARSDREGHIVQFSFSSEGADIFSEMTRRAAGKQIAILIDDKVISAPSVKKAIDGGDVMISGNFTLESAQNLATMLKSGAFLAPVTFEEERRIGPSLGAQSVKQGFFACLLALGLLALFSIFYYKLAGFLAFLALIYNLLLVIFIMTWLNATLTLPGIAGMVLTVGMAVDASVLIFEKIRELLAAGVSFKKAVQEGFSDAMVVILDGNITTFLVGIFLYKYGTGPIQGFAVTMMLGIVATLLTGLFFLRTLFNVVLDGCNLKKISI